MIVGSLVLILSAAGLLAGGLILGSDWLLAGSIVASLFAAALLYFGARQSASARRLERAAIDDEAWEDEEGDDGERHPWGARRGADPEFEQAEGGAGPNIERRSAEDVRSEFEQRVQHDARSEFDPAAAGSAEAPADPGTPAGSAAVDEQTQTSRIQRMYTNTRAGFGRYPTDSKGSLLDREEPTVDSGPVFSEPGPGEPADVDAAPGLADFGRPDRGQPAFGQPEPAQPDVAQPSHLDQAAHLDQAGQPDQWRTRPPAESGSGEQPRDGVGVVPPSGRAGEHAPVMGREPEPEPQPQQEWVGGGVDEEDPKDEPPIERRPARVAAAAARVETDVFVIDGRPRYHVAGCVHLLGRDSEPLPAAEAVELGFTPCGLCEPDSALAADAADNARR